MKFRKLLSAAVLFFAAFFVRGVEVVNAGHSGWNSRQLREIFRQELDKNRPDLIILMVGTNDNLNSYNLVPPEEFEKNLTAMAEAARASGAELLLCEIPNACQELMQKRHKADFFRRETAEDKVRRANQIVAAVAEAQRIPLLKTTEILGKATTDAASLIRNPANSGNEDGVHPTPNGYFRLADAIAKRIKAEQWKPKRILCIGDSITFGAAVKGAGTAAPDAETYPGRLARELNAR